MWHEKGQARARHATTNSEPVSDSSDICSDNDFAAASSDTDSSFCLDENEESYLSSPSNDGNDDHASISMEFQEGRQPLQTFRYKALVVAVILK